MKDAKAMQKVALRMILAIDKSFDDLAKKSGHEFAEGTYNAVAMTMLTRVCAGLVENRGKKAFEQYWEEVTEIMNDLVQQLACKETRH
jgi:hypothetical protein